MRAKLERITHLREPPVVGRRYLVPTVFYPWLNDTPRAWPVYLPKHDDAEHLNFPWAHYHVDPRFLNKRDTAFAAVSTRGREGAPPDDAGLAEFTTQARPLSYRDGSALTGHLPHPAIVWAARRCYRSGVGYRAGHIPVIQDLRVHFAGRQCKAVRSGWVCPHKRYPLGSLQPVDGVVTCPLHGLRVRVSDGVVV